MKKKNKIVNSLRQFRVWHRWVGITIALLATISALTGILLAFKKNVDLLQPPTNKGESFELSAWKSLAELAHIANVSFSTAYPGVPNHIDRIDVQPNKGIVKVLMEKGYWEVQLDGKSGEVLSIAQRHADWIEHLHDGSIISDGFKLISMNVLGWGLILMIVTGLWLWYGPKKIRKQRLDR
ncbi:MAG: PepSY domain-containing protein [Saprospiraceae bacterium]|nr:PepSY domain-containing protein [Saprospiraceae bacterium]